MVPRALLAASALLSYPRSSGIRFPPAAHTRPAFPQLAPAQPTMAGELTSFNEYEREFQSIASKLPGRITTVQGYAPAQEADANAELLVLED